MATADANIDYAAGDGWVETMPAGEWAAMGLIEQTRAVVTAFLTHTIRPDRSERERVFAGVSDPDLADQFWAVWGALPELERRVLLAVGVTVSTGPLPAGRAGECAALVTREAGGLWHTSTRIVVDPAQSDDPVRTLRHELAHAAYRHVEGQQLLTGRAAEDLHTTHEALAVLLAKLWGWMASDGL